MALGGSQNPDSGVIRGRNRVGTKEMREMTVGRRRVSKESYLANSHKLVLEPRERDTIGPIRGPRFAEE